ncbi:MAG: SAM-dependent methyltransferase, partial [Gammaproteobacteria bacterium]|nr:SAM-dependent methyltransferase [Gammaproteobacteria bacterium]
FFKWPVLAEILDLRGQGGMPLLEFGYLILVATLGQALLVSLVFILLPLLFYHRNSPGASQNINRFSVGGYFFALGLAFLFIEISFIQKFILFLHHPIYAIAVVLAAFLIFAGFGSAWSRGLAEQKQYAKGVKLAISAIITLGVLYLFILGPLFDALMNFSDISKILVSLLLIAPMAFFMGVPFPLGLARLGERAAGYIPWVWGVNGCASVLSAVLATLLAIHYGFTMVIISALLLYGLALISFSSRWDLPSSRQPSDHITAK